MDEGEGSAPAEKADGRRRQLLEHMDNLWRILGEVCEHSSLPERDLAGTMSRIEKLKGMSEELGTLEIDLEALHKVYTYESKAYLSKLRRLEEEVTSGSGSGEVEEEGAPSYGQNAIDGSFSLSCPLCGTRVAGNRVMLNKHIRSQHSPLITSQLTLDPETTYSAIFGRPPKRTNVKELR